MDEFKLEQNLTAQELKEGFRVSLEVEPTADNINDYLGAVINSLHEWILDVTGLDPSDITITNEIEDLVFAKAGVVQIFQKISEQIEKKSQIIDVMIQKVQTGAEQLSYMILPYDENQNDESETMSGSKETKFHERTAMALLVLEELGINLERMTLTTGLSKEYEYRQVSYNYLYIPEINRSIFVCDQVGNTTFIIDNKFQIDNSEAIGKFVDQIIKEYPRSNFKSKHDLDPTAPSYFTHMTKAMLKEVIDNFPGLGKIIRYSENWSTDLQYCLSNELTENSTLDINAIPHWYTMTWKYEDTNTENGTEWYGFQLNDDHTHFGAIPSISRKLTNMGYIGITTYLRRLSNQEDQSIFKGVRKKEVLIGKGNQPHAVYVFEDLLENLHDHNVLLGSEDGVIYTDSSGKTYITFEDYMYLEHSEKESLRYTIRGVRKHVNRSPVRKDQKILYDYEDLKNQIRAKQDKVLSSVQIEDSYNALLSMSFTNGSASIAFQDFISSKVSDNILKKYCSGIQGLRYFVDSTYTAFIQVENKEAARELHSQLVHRNGLEFLDDNGVVQIEGNTYISQLALTSMYKCDYGTIKKVIAEDNGVEKKSAIANQGREVDVYLREYIIPLLDNNIPPIGKVTDEGLLFDVVDDEMYLSVDYIQAQITEKHGVDFSQYSGQQLPNLLSSLAQENERIVRRNPAKRNTSVSIFAKDLSEEVIEIFDDISKKINTQTAQDVNLIFTGKGKITIEGETYRSANSINKEGITIIRKMDTNTYKVFISSTGKLTVTPMFPDSVVEPLRLRKEEFEPHSDINGLYYLQDEIVGGLYSICVLIAQTTDANVSSLYSYLSDHYSSDRIYDYGFSPMQYVKFSEVTSFLDDR